MAGFTSGDVDVPARLEKSKSGGSADHSGATNDQGTEHPKDNTVAYKSHFEAMGTGPKSSVAGQTNQFWKV